ncbi:MAG TPA: hypothetical protein VGY98_05455 [Verrucomicrobiae bacterium]|nr:hypothetical protein [Verrucomicrobiae bacterium]
MNWKSTKSYGMTLFPHINSANNGSIRIFLVKRETGAAGSP